MLLVPGYQFAAGQQSLHVGGRLQLPLVRPHPMHRLGERFNAAVVGIEGHGGYTVGPRAQMLSPQQRPHGNRTHILGAIEQGQAFLARQLNGFPSLESQQLGGRHHAPLVLHLAHAHQWQTHVGQRHQVARGPKRALTVDNRNNTLVEEVDQALHGVEFAARIAIAERLNLEHEHDAHNFVGQSVAHTASMRHHQVDLQLRQLVAAHFHVAQRPESGSHPIDGQVAAGNLLVEIFAAFDDTLPRVVAQRNFVVILNDFAHALYCEPFGTDMMNLHDVLLLIYCF